jgi:hypothetical protein
LGDALLTIADDEGDGGGSDRAEYRGSGACKVFKNLIGSATGHSTNLAQKL